MKIKKIAYILLSVLMILSLAACKNSKKAASDSDEDTVSKKDVRNLEELIEYLEEMEENIDDTVALLYNDNLTTVYDYVILDTSLLDSIYEDICDMKEDVEDYSSDNRKIQKTYDVAAQYFSELENCYGEFIKMSDFFKITTDAVLTYLNDEGIPRDDYTEYYSIVLNNQNTFCDIITTFDAPAYMKETTNKFIDAVHNYALVSKSYYYSYDNDDYLRKCATDYMRYYASENFNLFGVSYNDDYTTQLSRFYYLLNDRMQTYQSELIKYCEKQLEEPVNPKYSYYEEDTNPVISYLYKDTIYPSTYSTLDNVIKLMTCCDQGECDVIVKVEMPEFALTYEQKVTLYQNFSQLYIKPQIDSNANLDFRKEIQMKITVSDADTNKVYLQDSIPVTIMSKNDLEIFEVGGDDGSCYNVLAWMTPEAPEILELKRVAIDWLTEYTNGETNNIVGYQGDPVTIADAYDIVAEQIIAIQNAISEMGVRYNMDGYSSSDTSENYHQRVMYPAEVLKSKSGICIETSLLMASALQSANFNVMLVLPPGHCFVAVEVWPGTGWYISVETTCLPTSSYEIENYVSLWSKEYWQSYIDSKGCTVIDCSLAREIGFIPYFN